MKAEKKFKNYLKERGLKFTPERQIVLNAVFSLHNHFDVDQLQQKLRNMNKDISRATVYRTIPLFVDSDLIRETLHCQGKVKYEHIYGHKHHDHMVCLNCGRIIEFSDEEIEELQKQICEEKEFFPLEHRLGIKGYCRECAKKIFTKKKEYKNKLRV